MAILLTLWSDGHHFGVTSLKCKNLDWLPQAERSFPLRSCGTLRVLGNWAKRYILVHRGMDTLLYGIKKKSHFRNFQERHWSDSHKVTQVTDRLLPRDPRTFTVDFPIETRIAALTKHRLSIQYCIQIIHTRTIQLHKDLISPRRI